MELRYAWRRQCPIADCLQTHREYRFTKQLRLGEIEVNNQEVADAMRILQVNLMSGSRDLAHDSIDLAVFFLIKVRAFTYMSKTRSLMLKPPRSDPLIDTCKPPVDRSLLLF